MCQEDEMSVCYSVQCPVHTVSVKCDVKRFPHVRMSPSVKMCPSECEDVQFSANAKQYPFDVKLPVPDQVKSQCQCLQFQVFKERKLKEKRQHTHCINSMSPYNLSLCTLVLLCSCAAILFTSTNYYREYT